MKTFFEKELKTKIDEELYLLLVEIYKVGNADIAYDLYEPFNEAIKENIINQLKFKFIL